MNIGIIGGGKVGCSFAEYMCNLVGITASTKEKCAQLAERYHIDCVDNGQLVDKAKIILLTVPDNKIEEIAKEIAATKQVEGKIFLHCSGTLGLKPLVALRKAGAFIGRMHPMASFTEEAADMHGLSMASEGDYYAMKSAQKIAKAVGGTSLFYTCADLAAHHRAIGIM